MLTAEGFVQGGEEELRRPWSKVQRETEAKISFPRVESRVLAEFKDTWCQAVDCSQVAGRGRPGSWQGPPPFIIQEPNQPLES